MEVSISSALGLCQGDGINLSAITDQRPAHGTTQGLPQNWISSEVKAVNATSTYSRVREQCNKMGKENVFLQKSHLPQTSDEGPFLIHFRHSQLLIEFMFYVFCFPEETLFI